MAVLSRKAHKEHTLQNIIFGVDLALTKRDVDPAPIVPVHDEHGHEHAHVGHSNTLVSVTGYHGAPEHQL